MNGVAIFFIVLLVLLVVAAVGWVVFTQLRARRLGLPAPSVSSYNPFARSNTDPYGAQNSASGGGGIRGWFNDKLRGRNKRSAAGAYEQTGANTRPGGRGGFGGLDPDDAWDTRVGHHDDAYGAYYEEQELGGGNPYSGSGYAMNLAATPAPAAASAGYHAEDDPPRGRSRSRDGRSSLRPSQNPFDDEHAEPSNVSMRGVSPRPIDTAGASRMSGTGPRNDSPTSRKSVFREEV